MELIGEQLKSARLKKKLKIIDISKELKINKDLLDDIENDNIPDYINIIFLIGHIRAYAKLLNLEASKIIEDFKIQILYDNSSFVNEISKPISNKNFFSFIQIFAFSSFLFILFGFYFLFVKKNDFQPKYAITPEVPENLEFVLEEAEMYLALENLSISNTKLKIEDREKDLLNNEKDMLQINSSSVVASTQEDIISNIDELISLKFLDSTWVQLRDIEDNIIISKLMNKGDEYSYDLSKKFTITSGNGGNIVILLNGIVKGKAGRLGEVIDALIIDNNFNN